MQSRYIIALFKVQESRFEDYTLIFRALLLLRDAYVPMKRDGGLARKSVSKTDAKNSGLWEEATFTGDRWGQEGDTYLVRYAGRRCLLDRHLKRGQAKTNTFVSDFIFSGTKRVNRWSWAGYRLISTPVSLDDYLLRLKKKARVE